VSWQSSIRFTNHAIDQMNLRGFSRADVEAIVQDPQITYFGTDGKLNVVGTTPAGQARVVLVVEADHGIVITVIRLQ
jgi:hypothetical protein